MKKELPIAPELVRECMTSLHIQDAGNASIREIVALVNEVETRSYQRYVRMEMGVPGLPAAEIGVQAEIEALKNGVASAYPLIDGISSLKEEAARFIRLFMNVEVSSQGCVPTVGSMEATWSAFMVCAAMNVEKDTVLFIDPGFPVQKQQLQVLGINYETFDVYDFRGSKLQEKLESYLKKGTICSIVYSNPNNPSWVCLTEEELAIIGNLSHKYDVVVMEDLAYFAMDFRKDLHTPGQAPYQATVARYTNNYMLFISSSKIFSYAGQRIGMLIISDALFHREYPDLQKRFGCATVGNAVIFKILYAVSSGTSHSAQYALAAMFRAANEGKFNFIEDVKEYGVKAKIMKRLFIENNFFIVYDKDGSEKVGDGFYFTVGYPGMTGNELLAELLYYGISAISLGNTGSKKEGIRACVSHVQRKQFALLEERLKNFNSDHPLKNE